MPSRRARRWITIALIAAVLATFAISLVVAPRPSDADVAAFAGTDAVVTQIIEDEGYQPWFSPIFKPASAASWTR